jgi:uncharacterized membrane protein
MDNRLEEKLKDVKKFVRKMLIKNSGKNFIICFLRELIGFLLAVFVSAVVFIFVTVMMFLLRVFKVNRIQKWINDDK